MIEPYHSLHVPESQALFHITLIINFISYSTSTIQRESTNLKNKNLYYIYLKIEVTCTKQFVLKKTVVFCSTMRTTKITVSEN